MTTAPLPACDRILHQIEPHPAAPWAWTLASQQATTLAANAAPRWLRVDEGCVWATRHDTGVAQASDIWLAAGDSLALPPGSAWILEGWPQARLALLLQPQAAFSRSAAAVPSGSSSQPVARLRAGLQALLRWQRARLHAPAA